MTCSFEIVKQLIQEYSVPSVLDEPNIDRPLNRAERRANPELAMQQEITEKTSLIVLLAIEIIREQRASQYNRGLISKAGIENLCKQIALLPYVESQSSIKQAATPLMKYIDRYNRATQHAQSYEVQQTRQLLNQAKHYHAQAMQTLPAKENKPLGYIIQQIYALFYRYHGIELTFPKIRKLTALITPFDYTDAQINNHLTPAKRQKIKDNIDREKAAFTAAGVVEYSGSLKTKQTPPSTTSGSQSDNQRLVQAIALIQSCQSIESGDKHELQNHIQQIAKIYEIELDENQS